MQKIICIWAFVSLGFVTQAWSMDCEKSLWWQPEVILDAPEDLAQFISVENDGTLVKLQNKTQKSLYLVYKDKRIYRLYKNKVYRKVKVKAKDKWLKIQHSLPSPETGELEKTDASYLILSKDDFKTLSTSSKKDSAFFFEQMDKCGPDRLAGRPDARINFSFSLMHNKESQVVNGQAVLLPNNNYDAKQACCPK